MRIGSIPPALKLFGGSLTGFATLRVLLIVTFRPEFEPPWIGRPYVTALTINRLAQRDIEAMIDGVVGNKFIPASIRQDIIERTDGIPLFVEEMTKAVLEAGSKAQLSELLRPFRLPHLAVPASLQASLMARLDRLGSGQGGGADWRGYRARVLACPAGCGRAQAGGGAGDQRLTVSLQAGLLFRQGEPPHAKLPVQACPGAGRGLWHAAARATTRAACPHRRNSRKPIHGDR